MKSLTAARRDLVERHLAVAGGVSRGREQFASACYGLVQAAMRFEARRGLAFSTYATSRARGQIADDQRTKASWYGKPRGGDGERLQLYGAFYEQTIMDAPVVERREWLDRLTARMPLLYAMYLRLLGYGLSYNEIARRTGISAWVVGQRMAAALAIARSVASRMN